VSGLQRERVEDVQGVRLKAKSKWLSVNELLLLLVRVVIAAAFPDEC
jgi:hypothetical protein